MLKAWVNENKKERSERALDARSASFQVIISHEVAD